MGKIALKHVLKNFLNHFANLEAIHKLNNNETDLYHKEFQSLKELTESLKKDPNYSCSKGLEDVNIRKNRYKDILPYDYSRVILSDYPGVPGSDYINANYVKGSTGSTCYIASQGPLPSTLVDFWRMIWECEVTVIVMACNQTESGRFKCECYWPQTTDQDQQYGNITVSLVKWRQVCPDFLVRTLKIKSSNGEERVVCQFHYTTFPDHGSTSVQPILELVRLIRDVQASEARPILIHCSAGAGRTGTICSIDYVWALLRTGKLKEDFSLYQIISDMRRQRIAMVQTKEQYILCYRAVATLFEQQLKMINSHMYENLNEDGEPLINSDENDNEDDNETSDTIDNKLSSENISESSVNSEENSYYQFKPDLIKNKTEKNAFGSLKQSRLHKSTPSFDLFQQISNDDLIEKNNFKNSEKLVGKATVIRRSSRPSIAHLKAMFENMNLPNPDGFVYKNKNNRNSKKSNLKRSMSTREKFGSFNTWSSTNLFGQHGSFENLNYFNSKNSKDSDSVGNESKQDDDEYFNSNCNGYDKNNYQSNQYNEPIYGLNTKKENIDEIDNSYVIDNTINLPPPKPLRTYQNDNLEIKKTDNQFSQIIDYMAPSYLNKQLSSAKNYYNTIGPIKRNDRPSIYCLNDQNHLKTTYNQSKSTYNITNLHTGDNQLSNLFEPLSSISKSVSINELSNDNFIYDNSNQARFGVLGYKNQLQINTPLPNHLIKQTTTNLQQQQAIKNIQPQQQINSYQYKDTTQDFYGYIGGTNNGINTDGINNNFSNLNVNNINISNNISKPILQAIKCQQQNYQIPTLPKPNLQQQFSNTLPAHYNNQIKQQQPVFKNIQQPPPPQKAQPPMSYVRPTMRNTSAINIQYENRNNINNGNFRNHHSVINMTNGMITNNASNTKHISNGNLQNGSISNYSHTNGHLNNQLNGQIPNLTLGKLAKNYYQPNLIQQSNIKSNTIKSLQSNGQLNDKIQTIQTSNNNDKLSNNEQITNRQKIDNLKEQNETINSTTKTNTKIKRSAFNAISSIFGLGKNRNKKDSKQKSDKNSSTTNLNKISTNTSNGNTSNNGNNLIKPPHSHRFTTQWSMV